MLPLQQGGIAFLIQINMKNKKLQKWESNPRPGRTVDKNMLRVYSLCYVPALTN